MVSIVGEHNINVRNHVAKNSAHLVYKRVNKWLSSNRHSDKKISQDTTNDGRELQIWYSESVNSSKAISLILKVYSELIAKGFAGSFANLDDWQNCNVIYSTDEHDNILGGMVIEYRAEGRESFQHLNFTNPMFRGGRISTISRKWHQIVTMNRGGNKISSTIMVDNETSKKTAARDGMKFCYVRMYKWLI